MNRQEKKNNPKISKQPENVATSFINNERVPDEPLAKKTKTSPQDPDDSFKFFKSLRSRTTKAEAPSAVSNVATNFVNQTKKPPAKPTKQANKKKVKAQPDIRKILSKQEQMFHQVVEENCYQDGIDPEQMELALAISNSLKDTNMDSEASGSSSNQFENPFSSLGKVQPISAVLQKFGFKTKTKYSEYELELVASSKITKRSKFQKLPTALTRTSNEKRQENVRIRVDALLQQNLSNTILDVNNCDFNCVVYSPYLQEAQALHQNVFSINSEDRPTGEILFNYYVAELFEPSLIPAGHLLKDWSKIPGRDPTPERKPNKDIVVEENENENRETGVEVEAFEYKDISSVELGPNDIDQTCINDNFESSDVDDDSKISCSDIFADFEDSDDDNENEVASSAKDNSAELASKLDVLQEKLSQSIMDTDENNEKDEVNVCIEREDDLVTKLQESSEVQRKSLVQKFTESVDLTQRSSSVDSNGTIPYDDSYYSLQAHMKQKMLEKSDYARNHHDVESSSIEQINLVSSDDENPVEPENRSENGLIEKDSSEVAFSSQNSIEVSDNESTIDISDEEVNYSVRNYYENYERPDSEFNGASNSIDLTQEYAQEAEEISSQLDIHNLHEQSLADALEQKDDIDINDTVTSLLEKTSQESNLNATRNRSIKVREQNYMSDSIQEIMAEFGGTSGEKNRSGTLRKMQSESMLLKQKITPRRSVHFDIQEEDEEHLIDLTQAFEFNDSMKENFNLERSIHQSLENISNYSPNPPRDVVRQQKLKKSLGLQIDADFHVDTETTVAEPDFKNMTPVELKQALFKFGIRTLPVKKAVSLLEFIYNQLHPTIQAAADEEIDANDSRREMNITDIITNIGVLGAEDYVFQPGTVDDEDFVLPKMRKSKIPTCAIPLHVSFHNMVRSNEKIQRFILEYRPLELDQIHKHFRKFGLSYLPNDIISFLDRRCITFKTKEQSYSKTHERKKQKRTQNSQKSQASNKRTC